MNTNENDIEKVIQILSTCSTMKEASVALKKNERTLRKWFKRFNLPSPSNFLNSKINEFIEDSSILTDDDKLKIRALYTNSLTNKGNTVDELSLILNKSKSKIKDYLKEINLKHDDLPIQTKVFNQTVINNEIKEFLDFSLRSNAEVKITDTLRKDALKWRNWKENVSKDLFDLLDKKIPKYKIDKFNLKDTEPFGCVLSIQDFHLGRFSSITETNFNTDLEIQIEDFKICIRKLVSKISKFGKIDKLFLTIGGDFINSDNSKITTTHGTPQDSVPSHTLLQIQALLLLIYMVDTCRTISNEIELVFSGGNHDHDNSVSMYLAVSAWFKDCEDIKTFFDEKTPNARKRQYRTYGDNLLVFAHGDGPKAVNMPIIIANEARQIWGKTKHTMYFSGHHHVKINQDINNIQHFQQPSLALDDRWSYDKGFQNNKGMSIVLLDKKDGYIGELVAHPE